MTLATKGRERVNKDLDSIKIKLASGEEGTVEFAKKVDEAAKKHAEAQTKIAHYAKWATGITVAAFALVGAAVTRMAFSGLQGSAEMEHFNDSVNRLSQRFGAVLMPAIEAITKALNEFLEGSDDRWARMQDAVEKIAVEAIPVMIDAFERLGEYLDKAVIPAMELIAKYADKIAAVMKFVVSGAVTHSPFSDEASKRQPEKAGKLRLPTPIGKGFEGSDQTFKRFQMGINRLGGGGKTPEERTADATEKMERLLDENDRRAKIIQPNQFGK